ncbi:hypothetical protein Tco_1510008 [Tanacetum coccineum]
MFSSQNNQVDNCVVKPIRIIPSLAGIVQTAKLHKLVDTRKGGEESVMSTQEYIRKVIKDVGEDDGFTRAPWLSAIDYVNVDGGIVMSCFGDVKKFLKNGKLEQIIAVIKSCTPNALGDLTVTLKTFLVQSPILFITKCLQRRGLQRRLPTSIPLGCAKSRPLSLCAKLYGCEPSSIESLFWRLFFFNLFPGGKWLTFAKRPEKHIPHLFTKVITRIEGWKGQFFFIQNSVVPAEYSQLFSKDNRWDTKTYKDKLPPNIEENPMFQHLGRYPTSVRVFPDPILFLAGLKPSWEFGQQWPIIIVDGEEMSFRNFMYADIDEDQSFLPKEPCLDDGTGSPSVLINAEPPLTIVEATEQLMENTTDSGGSPQPKKLVIHTGCVAGRINERKCKTRGGSSRPPIKRKLVQRNSCLRSSRVKTSHQIDSSFVVISDDDEGHPDIFELQDATACHLKISAITPPAWKGHLDNQLDLELFDLYDRCYARQAVVDNAVNFKARELLKVVEQIKGECKVLKEREKSIDQECEELRIKCKAAKTYFDKNTNVVALRKKIVNLQGEVKDYRDNLDKMLLESHGLAIRLESAEASLHQELENAKHDRAEVVSKVVPYVATKLVQSEDMGNLVAKLVNASIFYGRCHAFEEVTKMNEPFDITKVKGYMSSYKQEHIKAGNDHATATFPFLIDVVANPYASVEVLLFKKPWILQRPAPTRTQIPTSSAPSQKATSSPALMSPPPQVNLVTTQSLPLV